MRKRWAWALLGLVGILACDPPAHHGPGAAGLENGSFTAELNGFTIHYEVHGHGPTLMTLPNSWGITLEGLRGVYRPLEAHRTLVYFDPRGMGGSGPIREDEDMSLAAVRADFLALQRHLGLETVDTIGWSNGAMNLLLLAAESPETLSSAIFLHGSARFDEEDGAELQAQHPEFIKHYAAFLAEIGEFAPEEQNARMKGFILKEWPPVMFADPEAGADLLAGAFRDAEFSWPHSAYSSTETPTFDFRDRLSAIRAPSLVIAGAHDVQPPEAAREIHAGIPGSRFVVFEHSGHFAPLEEPELFVETALDFLEGYPREG